MSIGPSVAAGLAGSAAGTPASQAKAGEAARAGESRVQENRAAADVKARDAAGIGQADGSDHETEERDADGRRIWEADDKAKAAGGHEAAESPEAPRSRDASGAAGTQLDLLG